NAYAVLAQRNQFVIRGESPEYEKNRRQQSPGNGKDEREGQHVSNERDQVFHRDVVINQQREQLAENVSDHEHEAQHGNRKRNVDQQLATDEPIDQFHF